MLSACCTSRSAALRTYSLLQQPGRVCVANAVMVTFFRSVFPLKFQRDYQYSRRFYREVVYSAPTVHTARGGRLLEIGHGRETKGNPPQPQHGGVIVLHDTGYKKCTLAIYALIGIHIGEHARQHTPETNFKADFLHSEAECKRRATRLWKDMDEIFPKALFSSYITPLFWRKLFPKFVPGGVLSGVLYICHYFHHHRFSTYNTTQGLRIVHEKILRMQKTNERRALPLGAATPRTTYLLFESLWRRRGVLWDILVGFLLIFRHACVVGGHIGISSWASY